MIAPMYGMAICAGARLAAATNGEAPQSRAVGLHGELSGRHTGANNYDSLMRKAQSGVCGHQQRSFKRAWCSSSGELTDSSVVQRILDSESGGETKRCGGGARLRAPRSPPHGTPSSSVISFCQPPPGWSNNDRLGKLVKTGPQEMDTH
ncbi:hypothetical protein VTN00DRAFT_1974 [Thermoascus crustaceus]|uniref:uncharacterized protein n=1 Tax=Thermoascus crustaceus TaxID=5088 RepID=UPI003742B530